jgi:hypothetical protein
MAIKPNDCVIRIKDLEIGVETITDYGRSVEVPVYEKYWTNFSRHVKDTTDWKAGGWNAYDKNFEQQLAKFNATFKNTKKYDERYIKFKSHSDLTFFILRWS